MSDYVAVLEERIKRLKSDWHATQDWTKLKIEIQKRGGKWRAENGMVFELIDGAIYQYLGDFKGGVADVVVTALDAPIPFVAELSLDLQGTPPEKRAAILKELGEEASKSAGAPAEVITIVKGDWLSKRSLARWKTIHWERHLKPTRLTLEARRRRGKKFDPNLIYPGDTFEVVG